MASIETARPELIGFACWFAIFVAFCIFRHIAPFAAAALTLIVAFLYVSASSAAPVTTGAVLVGLVAWSLGLSLFRAMLTRSVSLELLIGCTTGAPADFDQSIASRLDDAVRYRLAASSQRGYELAPLGRVVSLITSAAYRAFRTAQ